MNSISGAVRRNRMLQKPSHADIEEEMKLWLRQSCDGNGGRRARAEGSQKVNRYIRNRAPAIKAVKLSSQPLHHGICDIEPQ